ncbi:MAG: hypothetical protein ACXW2B_08915 [Methylomagnum sp.]
MEGLQSAIDQARQRLADFHDELRRTAADTKRALLDELDQINENDRAIENRRYRQQVAELQKTLDEANKAKDKQAVKDTEDALALAEEIHLRKLEAIKEEEKARSEAQEKAAKEEAQRQDEERKRRIEENQRRNAEQHKPIPSPTLPANPTATPTPNPATPDESPAPTAIPGPAPATGAAGQQAAGVGAWGREDMPGAVLGRNLMGAEITGWEPFNLRMFRLRLSGLLLSFPKVIVTRLIQPRILESFLRRCLTTYSGRRLSPCSGVFFEKAPRNFEKVLYSKDRASLRSGP